MNTLYSGRNIIYARARDSHVIFCGKQCADGSDNGASQSKTETAATSLDIQKRAIARFIQTFKSHHIHVWQVGKFEITTRQNRGALVLSTDASLAPVYATAPIVPQAEHIRANDARKNRLCGR